MLQRKGRAKMGDYHHDVRFGANVDPTANDPSWPLRLTHAIEKESFFSASEDIFAYYV